MAELHKLFKFQPAGAALGTREIRVVASDPTIDRVGDSMVPEGCQLSGYRRNPIVLANHDSNMPIGNAAVEIKNSRVEALITFAPAGISAKADEFCGLAKTGVLAGVSIGFSPVESAPLPNGGTRYKKWELLEISLVAVPANPQATVFAKSAHGATSAQRSSVRTSENEKQMTAHDRHWAKINSDPYVSDGAAYARGLTTSKGLCAAACFRAFAAAHAFNKTPEASARAIFGENHPVSKALLAGYGGAGGFVIPPDFVTELIELLRPAVAVREAGPMLIPMPKGTKTLPAQTAAASATWGAEVASINESMQAFGDIVLTAKKLSAIVTISNDLLRYADPAMDAIVRDDLTRVIGLAEDSAYLFGIGVQSQPKGLMSFANQFAVLNGGIAGSWLSNANSTAAGGGNFVTSLEAFTIASIVNELAGLAQRLATQNVPVKKRVFLMHSRTFWALATATNSLAIFQFPDLLDKKKIWGIPVIVSNQIPVNIWDSTGTNKDCSFVFLVESTEMLLAEGRQLELEPSTSGTITDQLGNVHSMFQEDKTAIRAIMETDFSLRHIAAIAVAQFVRWQTS